MKTLNFETGVAEYKVNGKGVLRMNPGDPNLYARFFDAQDKLLEIEKDLEEQGRSLPDLPENATEEKMAEIGESRVRFLQDADRKVKALLNQVFPGNDFEALFGGVNVMAVTSNGERVITNFLAALLPILSAGVDACAENKTTAAVEQARINRAQRRSQSRGKG